MNVSITRGKLGKKSQFFYLIDENVIN